jgi:alpha-tubulin suppressor-like RCC1 family protein
MSIACYRALVVLVLSLAIFPAMAARTCNTKIIAETPSSRYVIPGTSKLQCWGANANGQLGNATLGDFLTPVTVSGIGNALALGAGISHTCALGLDRKIQCWGRNGEGQLGNGTTVDSFTPVSVAGISTAVGLAVGDQHSCARLANGKVRCWGLNSNGQLGDDSTVNSSSSVAVTGIDGINNIATAIATGGSHSCAVLSDGTVRCWGWNGKGQLGDGTLTQSPIPVAVNGIDGINNIAIAVAAGGSHSCARLSTGKVLCWGSNANGQLGSGNSTPQFTSPVSVTGIATAISITAGTGHSCALLTDGAVKCWGLNADGQLGNGTTTDSLAPITVNGIDGVNSVAVEIAAGGSHSCALLSDGTIKCWGLNAYGELGTGDKASSTTPVTVSGIHNNASAIAAGEHHSCARLSTDTGTVLDAETGLMWKRCSEGQTWDLVKEACVGDARTLSWQEALQRAHDVNLLGKFGENLGYNDWRLPNRNELISIIEYQCHTPATNSTIFPSTAAAPYWSSSPSQSNAQRAWRVDFLDGRVNDALKTDGADVRLIRGGQ